MRKIDRTQAARVHSDEWRVVYDWFAGWRWEHYRGGAFVDECLASFETEAECRADVQRRRAAAHTETRESVTASGERERMAA